MRLRPNSRFRFTLNFFAGKKEPYQVVMTEDDQARVGDRVFVQAESETGYDDAIVSLTKRFEALVQGRIEKIDLERGAHEARLSKERETAESVLVRLTASHDTF